MVISCYLFCVCVFVRPRRDQSSGSSSAGSLPLTCRCPVLMYIYIYRCMCVEVNPLSHDDGYNPNIPKTFCRPISRKSRAQQLTIYIYIRDAQTQNSRIYTYISLCAIYRMYIYHLCIYRVSRKVDEISLKGIIKEIISVPEKRLKWLLV